MLRAVLYLPDIRNLGKHSQPSVEHLRWTQLSWLILEGAQNREGKLSPQNRNCSWFRAYMSLACRPEQMPSTAFGFTFKKYCIFYQGDALQALWCGAEQTFLSPQIKIRPAAGCTQATVLLRVPEQKLKNNYHTGGNSWLSPGISCSCEYSSSPDSLGKCCHHCPSQCYGRVPAKTHSGCCS